MVSLENLMLILCNLFWKKEGENTSQIIWDQYYPDAKTRQRQNKTKKRKGKENYRPIALIHLDIKMFFKKILASWIQRCINRIIHHDQVGSILDMQGKFNIWKSTNVIYSNRIQKKRHMIISIDARKAFDKFQHPLIIKILSTLEIEGYFITLIKNIYRVFRANR